LLFIISERKMDFIKEEIEEKIDIEDNIVPYFVSEFNGDETKR